MTSIAPHSQTPPARPQRPVRAPNDAAIEAGAPAAPSGKQPAEERRHTLERLTIKRRTTSAQAAARSQLVRRLRIGLPILALALIAIFWRNMSSDTPEEAFLDDFKLNAIPEELEMAAPVFSGVDSDGNPFRVTAEAATRMANEDNVVALRAPRALTQEGTADSSVAARTGVYRQDEKRLDLSEDVVFSHSIGEEQYVLKTPAAVVRLEEKIVTTEAGVQGEGPDGAELTADRMIAHQEDSRVVFEGNVRMKIYPVTDDPVIGVASKSDGSQNDKDGSAPQ